MVCIDLAARNAAQYLSRRRSPRLFATVWPSARRLPTIPFMYLLYLDESGSAGTEYFVVGGVAVHEHDAHLLSRAADRLAEALPAPVTGAELHADHMRIGRNRWRQVPKDVRQRALRDTARLLRRKYANSGLPPVLFGVVLHTPSVSHDPYERAYEEIFARCNGLLGRLSSAGDHHRCVAISDTSRHETRLQELMAAWRSSGTSTGASIRPMRAYAEVPVFVDSAASRGVQMADFVANSIYRAYASGDTALFDQLIGGFDADGQTIHGLVHLSASYRTCHCIACQSRRPAPAGGP